MLVLVHRSLARFGADAWEEGRRNWLYLDPEGLLHKGNPDVSGLGLKEVLAGQLVKSTHSAVTVNRLVLVVPSVQPSEVQQTLGYLLKLPREDYWVDVSLVSVCDMQAEGEVAREIGSVQQLLAADRDGRLRSVWMMGRTTSLKDPIGSELRIEATDYLLQLLSQGGEECAFQIGLLPTGEGQRTPCRLCAWGFRSFMPGAAEIDSLMGAEYRRCVATGLDAQSKVDKTLPDLMEQKATGFLAAGVDLDLAFDGQEDGGAKPWRDTLPVPPETPLRTWQCHLLGTGDEVAWLAKGLLRGHEPRLSEYYQSLVSFLRKQSRNIRLKGQERLAHISQDARLFVLEEKRLHRLSVALRHFFPKFQVSASPSLPTVSCPREHEPSQADVIRTIIYGVLDKATARCKDELLSAKTRAMLLIGFGLVVACSVLMLWKLHWDLRALAPAMLALLVLIVIDAMNRRVFNRIKAAMNAEMEAEQARLRADFAAKIEWVLEKTGLTVRTQVIADMTALENLVRRKIDFLNGVGSFAQPTVAAQTLPAEQEAPASAFLPSEVRDQIRDTIADAGTQIVSLSDDVGELEWDRVLENARRQIATLMEPAAPGTNTPLDERLLQCCEVETPPFLARYDGVFNQKPYTKLFLVPRNTPQTWLDAIQTKANRGDQQVATYRSDFKGASVLVRYSNLREDQLLPCFGFPQRQEG